MTTADVRFICGDDEVNMKEGECWLFDTWRRHRVINAAHRERIHLVADTVGSDQFWQMAEKGRIPSNVASPGHWQPENFVGSTVSSLPHLAYESTNLPTVMTPWELREILHFLLQEAQPHEQLEPTRNLMHRFIIQWQALWTRYGDEQVAWPQYREVLNSFEQAMVKAADSLVLVNGSGLMEALRGLVLWPVLADRKVGLFARGAGKIP
jgi:Aspartyl/Asparaginyl beta-hydroxylase.